MQNRAIDVRARGVIIHKNKILVCKTGRKPIHYFLPGGGVEFGETGVETLQREMQEEMKISVAKSRPIGIVENFFRQRGKRVHEINFVFETKLKKYPKDPISFESHISFDWLPVGKFSQANVLPLTLKKQVSSWIKNKKFFFISEMDW